MGRPVGFRRCVGVITAVVGVGVGGSAPGYLLRVCTRCGQYSQFSSGDQLTSNVGGRTRRHLFAALLQLVVR
jgi:hypothetical protein